MFDRFIHFHKSLISTRLINFNLNRVFQNRYLVAKKGISLSMNVEQVLNFHRFQLF